MSRFSPSGSGSGGSSSITGLTKENPSVINQVLTNAAEEYTLVVPANAVAYRLKARQATKLQVAYVSGQSGTTYRTLEAGCLLIENFVQRSSGLNLYLQAPLQAGVTVELEYWT